ncbi:MAG: hypothetical protein ACRDLO_05135, partial [Solirubrobacterales bacterium]
FCAEIGRADRRGVQSLITRVRDEQEEANVALAGFLSDDRLSGIAERLDQLVAAAADRGAAPEPEQTPSRAELPGEARVAMSVNGGGAD